MVVSDRLSVPGTTNQQPATSNIIGQTRTR
jgi:hypothetical protein